jgi:hypothetical protein
MGTGNGDWEWGWDGDGRLGLDVGECWFGGGGLFVM